MWELILVGVGTAIGWFVKAFIEQIRSERERLQTERVKIYEEILDPFIKIIASLRDSEGADHLPERDRAERPVGAT